MSNKALLLIDIQEGLDELDFYGGARNNSDAEANCGRILNLFREKGWPVFHVKHNSTNPESPLFPGKQGNQIKAVVFPKEGEPVFEKNVNSAFIGTDLQQTLEAREINQLVIVGLTTEHCISTSVRMAANLGFEVILVSDATAAFDKVGVEGEWFEADLVHRTTLATLKDEFAQIIDTESLLKEG